MNDLTGGRLFRLASLPCSLAFDFGLLLGHVIAPSSFQPAQSTAD